MMKKLLLILNPTAGQKKAVRSLAEIISIFNRADYDTHVFVTAARGDATKAIQRWGADMDLVVCCGGDGTLNETVTGVIDGNFALPIGYIPAGSTNDFATSLHLSSDVLEAARQVPSGTPTPYDIGQWNERYFTYIASFGVFTRASYSTPQNIKNALGHVAYVLEGIQELSNIRKEHVRITLLAEGLQEEGQDEEVLDDDYLFGAVCNSTSMGGVLKLNPAVVDMADGQFELLLIRAPRDLQELHECVVALTNQTYNCGMITFRRVNSLCVQSTPQMAWSLDGEKAVSDGVVRIQNLYQRIRLMQ